jgi:hypothetical protein
LIYDEAQQPQGVNGLRLCLCAISSQPTHDHHPLNKNNWLLCCVFSFSHQAPTDFAPSYKLSRHKGFLNSGVVLVLAS